MYAIRSYYVEDGKVVGIKATQANGTKLVLRVNNGVVLASGGFGSYNFV